MGLDMYLTKEIYVAAKYEHRNITGSIDLKQNGKSIKVNFKKISTIKEDVGYWRKANQIHNWFVDNVQGGTDDCGTYDVSYEQLLELKALCEKVIETKDASLLPPTAGFFFGSTEVDEYYFEDLKETINIINELDEDGDYKYHASW